MTMLPQKELNDFYDAIAALPPSWKDLDMMTVVKPAIPLLPYFIAQQEEWKSVYINYEQPYLMRLFREFKTPSRHNPSLTNKIRFNFHYFFGKTDEEIDPYSHLINPYALSKQEIVEDDLELYHFHPWATGFHLIEGSYDQQIGIATSCGIDARPPVTECRTQQATNELTRSFAFNSPYIWHRVIPRDLQPVATCMVTYVPQDWGQVSPVSPILRPLHQDEKQFMLNYFADKLQVV